MSDLPPNSDHLLDVCLELHALNIGILDMEDASARRAVLREYIQRRIAAWKPGQDRSAEFDGAVLLLCHAVLKEAPWEA